MNAFKRMGCVPEGHATIAQGFDLGTGAARGISPEGTSDDCRDLTRLFNRPFRTYRWLAIGPKVETLGYSQPSLRDEVGNPSGVGQECPRSAKWVAFKLLSLTALLFLTGCRGAPSINLVGSFFPSWMLCVALGVIGVLLCRRIFVRTGIEPHLGAVPLVYFCLWVLLTLSLWLGIFRS